jgi:hypothetical protein
MTLPQENAGYFMETRYITVSIPISSAPATMQSIIAAGTDQSTGATITADTLSRIAAATLFNGTGTATYGGSTSAVPLAIAANAIVASNPLSTMWRKNTFVASTSSAYTAWFQVALTYPTGSHG